LPTWNDRNLRELAGRIRARLVFAHIRASSGTPVRQTNCHPFRHGKWLWMHNGSIARFQYVKREIMLAVDPSLDADIEGSTDSEVFFFLALTFGLENNPPTAVERAVGFIERVSGHQVSDSNDRRCKRWPDGLGLPKLKCRSVAIVLLYGQHDDASSAVSEQSNIPRTF
jgi:predicted glutamine amidotransferase